MPETPLNDIARLEGQRAFAQAPDQVARDVKLAGAPFDTQRNELAQMKG